ncbi:MAG: AmmeMemoRadiSam system protein B [Caldilineaceae bacterium]|nr:AmmeMemoRadiSam system protein B [Caldilineaceae bacterium]
MRAAHPKLRSLDIRPHSQNGRQYFLLRDPLQLSDNMLLVPQPLGALLAFCDGSYSARGMAQAFHAHYGFPIGLDTVEQLLRALDEACLLDNERSEAALHRAREQFRAAPFRTPAMAGGSYPADPDLLHAALEAYRRQAANGHPPLSPLTPTPTFGLLSPHIDYPRGGLVYAQVWERAASAVREADLVIIFATDHYGSDPFTLTRQNYATPYGTLPTATAIVDQVAAVIGEEAAFAGELRHIGEHSLELVTVWLHHLRNRRPVEIVPILCGGFHRFYGNGDHPDHDDQITQVLATLRAASTGRRVVVVASGDLAHVGAAFGQEPLDEATLDLVHSADQGLIQQMAAGDADAFYRAIHAIGDQHNVCGVAPIYLTMKLLGAIEGTPAGYATCPADNEDTSVVTVGGVIWQG